MKKILLIFLMMSLMLVPVLAEERNYVSDISECYENAIIKVRGTDTSSIKFDGCELWADGRWNCVCKKPTPILLLSSNNSINEYDIVVEYYIGTIKIDENKRTLNFNNVKIGRTIEEQKTKMPKMSQGGLIFFVMLVILCFIIFILFKIGKWLFNSDDAQLEEYDSTQDKELDNLLEEFNT